MPGRAAILAVKIIGDSKGAQAALSDTDKHVSDLSKNFDGLVGPAAVAFGAITAGAGFAIKAASDLAETQNKVDVVFGDSAGTIKDWASNAATSMGMSNQAALDAAGSFGTMFQALGFSTDQAVAASTGMTQLAADLASFHNVSGGAAQVTDMMSAAFRGEYDSIQALIPTINAASVQNKALEQTGKTSASALTEQEKATATLALITEGAGPAVGDFAATQDNAANSSRTAKASMEDAAAALGTALLPAVESAAGALTTLADWMSKNQEVVKTVIGVVAAFSAGVLIAKGVTTAWTVATKAMRVVMGLVKVAQIAWTVATNAYAISAIAAGAASMIAYWPILLIIAAIAALVAVIVVIVKNWDKLIAAFKKGASWLKGVFVGAWDAVSGAISRVVDWFQKLWDKAKNVMDSVGGVLDKINPFSAGDSTVTVLPAGLGVSAQSSAAPVVNINVSGVADPYALARLLTRQLKDYAHVQGRAVDAPLAGAW